MALLDNIFAAPEEYEWIAEPAAPSARDEPSDFVFNPYFCDAKVRSLPVTLGGRYVLEIKESGGLSEPVREKATTSEKAPPMIYEPLWGW